MFTIVSFTTFTHGALRVRTRPGPTTSAILPPFPLSQAENVRPRNGSIRHCLFINDEIKSFDDILGGGSDYVGGIDMMYCP